MSLPVPNNMPVEVELETTIKEKKTFEQIAQECDTIENFVRELEFLTAEELPPNNKIFSYVETLLSKKHSIVLLSGKMRIAKESTSEYGTEDLEYIARNDFTSFNLHLKIPYTVLKKDVLERKEKAAADIFLQSNNVPRFAQVMFNPSRAGDYGKVKNLFKGFPFNAQSTHTQRLELNEICTDREDVLRFATEHYPKCSRFFEHIFDNVADGEETAALQFIAWIADILQKPERSPLIAPVLRSDAKGTGKSIIGQIIGALVGKDHYFKTSTPEQILGKFNQHLMKALFVVGEEMTWGGSIDTNNRVKDLVTTGEIAIEPKGINPFMCRKYFRLMLVTNSSWAVSASKDERRFLVFDVAAHQAQNEQYFSPLFSGGKLDAAFLQDLYSCLIAIDYTAIDLTKAEQTRAIQAQKMATMTPLEEWWSECLEDGELWSENSDFVQLEPQIPKAENTFYEKLTKREVHNSYLKWLDKKKPKASERYTSRTTFGREFVKTASAGNKSLIQGGAKLDGENAYKFASLEQLRSAFNSQY